MTCTNKNLVTLAGLLIAAGAATAGEVPHGEIRSSAGLLEYFGEETARYFEGVIEADETIEWELYVPAAYDPDRPAGVMVYVSPMDSGEIPARWKSVMDDHNLIWIGANRSGNRVSVVRRVSFALLASSFVSTSYKIDKSRVYLSGFSGGGRVASRVAPEYAHIFKGAIYICGVNFWDNETPGRIDEMRTNRYVFVTGSEDFNRRETRRVHKSYRKTGVRNVLLLDIAHMSHSNPSKRHFAEAIAFLDDEVTAQGEEESQ